MKPLLPICLPKNRSVPTHPFQLIWKCPVHEIKYSQSAPHPSFFIREPVVSSSDSHTPLPTSDTLFDLQGRPFLRALFRALEVGPGTDYETLFALLLFSTIRTNPDEAFVANLPSKKSFGSNSSVSAHLEVPCSRNQIFSVGSTPSFFIREPVVSSSDSHTPLPTSDTLFDLQGRPFLRALFRALEVGPGTDYETLFALLLFSTIRTNPGIDLVTLQLACLSGPRVDQNPAYDGLLIGKLLDLIHDACKAGSRVRLITLHLAVRLLTDLVCDEGNRCYLSDEHFAQIISAREEAMMMLRSYFQNNAIFLDLFEHELRQLLQPGLSFSQLIVDSSLLIPPLTATVLSCPSLSSDKVHREHWRRLPRTETEHMQRAIGVYLLIHIWLESLLRTRTVDQEEEMVEALQPPSTVQPGAMLFSFNRPVDFGVIPGLAGLCNISDPKASTQIHKAGDKLDLCTLSFFHFRHFFVQICNYQTSFRLIC
ncbi:hypothetical protein AHF37_04602 [Paragonimus kellicotti]|nr:hypothetical protein AHF37_04602 [Paragonimus kellicotti]